MRFKMILFNLKLNFITKGKELKNPSILVCKDLNENIYKYLLICNEMEFQLSSVEYKDS